jgi:NAD(P)-dependent dehydrogenase (short-subunit alcohol dehydrogenase family)
MKIQDQTALVTGAASGLGEATARELARLGARVAVLDMNLARAEQVAAEIEAAHGAGRAVACECDITRTESLQAALDRATQALGPARILMNVAGIGSAKRIVQKDGSPAPLEDFLRVVNVNLVGSYNAARLFAAACAKLDPLEDGERGVMLFTASVAAFDGQVGQQAYSASKGGLVGMTLPMARDLAQHGIRVCTIAPGLFATPLMKELPEAVQQSLAASIPFPPRLGKPEEFAQLAAHVVTNTHLNGEVIRLDGALRMAPR